MDRLFYLSLYELMAQQFTHLVGLIYSHLPIFHCEVILSLETRRVPFRFHDIYESVASSLLISSTLAKWTLRHTQTLYIKIAQLDISQVSCSSWCIRETSQITALLASVVTFLVYDIAYHSLCFWCSVVGQVELQRCSYRGHQTSFGESNGEDDTKRRALEYR